MLFFPSKYLHVFILNETEQKKEKELHDEKNLSNTLKHRLSVIFVAWFLYLWGEIILNLSDQLFKNISL